MKKPWLILPVAIALIASGCKQTPQNGQTSSARFVAPTSTVFQTEQSVPTIPSPVQTDHFIDTVRLKNAYQTVTPSDQPCKQPWSAALINHHVLASDLMLTLVQDMKRCNPDLERIIILSPDHFHQAQASIATTDRTFAGRGHETKSDPDTIKQLTDHLPFIKNQPQAFDQEHGIAAPVRFILEEYEKVTVIPFILSGSITQDEAKQFVAWLKTQEDPHTLILISSDMSHYLPKAQAQRSTQSAEQALTQNDAEFFWKAKDDMTDTGKAFWMIMQIVGQKTWSEIASGASWNYGGSTAYTTTYVVGSWKK